MGVGIGNQIPTLTSVGLRWLLGHLSYEEYRVDAELNLQTKWEHMLSRLQNRLISHSL